MPESPTPFAHVTLDSQGIYMRGMREQKPVFEFAVNIDLSGDPRFQTVLEKLLAEQRVSPSSGWMQQIQEQVRQMAPTYKAVKSVLESKATYGSCSFSGKRPTHIQFFYTVPAQQAGDLCAMFEAAGQSIKIRDTVLTREVVPQATPTQTLEALQQEIATKVDAEIAKSLTIASAVEADTRPAQGR